ncbi:MAG: hypothetical protein VZS44_08600 [Bacilli bacterium]|nr:hypothetical protein [Bacilli bacterium]
MEKLKEIVIEFNKKGITYDLELHSYNPNLSPQMGLHLLTSEKRKILIHTCIKILTYEDMPQNIYLYSISMSIKDYYRNVGILIITPTSTFKILKNLV